MSRSNHRDDLPIKNVFDVRDAAAQALAAGFVGEYRSFSANRTGVSSYEIFFHDGVTPGGFTIASAGAFTSIENRLGTLESDAPDDQVAAVNLVGTDLQLLLNTGGTITGDMSALFDNINVLPGLYEVNGGVTSIPLSNGSQLQLNSSTLATDAELAAALAAAVAALPPDEFLQNVAVDGSGVANFLTNQGNSVATLDVAGIAQSVDQYLNQPTLTGTNVTFPMESGVNYVLSLASLNESLTDNGDGTLTFDDGEGNATTFRADTDDQVVSSPDNSLTVVAVPQPDGQIDYRLTTQAALIPATDPTNANANTTLQVVLDNLQTAITAATANSTNTSLTVSGGLLIITDSDGNTVDIPQADIIAGLDPDGLNWNQLSPASAVIIASMIPANTIDPTQIDLGSFTAAEAKQITDALGDNALDPDTIDWGNLSAADIATLEGALTGIGDTDVSGVALSIAGANLRVAVTEDGNTVQGDIPLATLMGSVPAGSITRDKLAPATNTTTASIVGTDLVINSTVDGVLSTTTVPTASILGNALPADAAGSLTNDGAGNLTWQAGGAGDDDITAATISIVGTNVQLQITEPGVGTITSTLAIADIANDVAANTNLVELADVPAYPNDGNDYILQELSGTLSWVAGFQVDVSAFALDNVWNFNDELIKENPDGTEVRANVANYFRDMVANSGNVRSTLEFYARPNGKNLGVLKGRTDWPASGYVGDLPIFAPNLYFDNTTHNGIQMRLDISAPTRVLPGVGIYVPENGHVLSDLQQIDTTAAGLEQQVAGATFPYNGYPTSYIDDSVSPGAHMYWDAGSGAYIGVGTPVTAPTNWPNQQIFSFTGATDSFAVPAGTEWLRIRGVGAGGSNDAGRTGGVGGGMEVIMQVNGTTGVNAGDTLTVVVGEGLIGQNTNGGAFGFGGNVGDLGRGAGGGLTGVFTSPPPIGAGGAFRVIGVAGGGGGSDASANADSSDGFNGGTATSGGEANFFGFSSPAGVADGLGGSGGGGLTGGSQAAGGGSGASGGSSGVGANVTVFSSSFPATPDGTFTSPMAGDPDFGNTVGGTEQNGQIIIEWV